MNPGQGLGLESVLADGQVVVAEREFGEAVIAVGGADRVAGQTGAHVGSMYLGIRNCRPGTVGHSSHNASTKRLRGQSGRGHNNEGKALPHCHEFPLIAHEITKLPVGGRNVGIWASL